MPSPVYNNYANIITFSRGTNATLTDSTGKITYAPANLLTYSQTFTDAAWGKLNSTIATTTATTAPDGTLTANTMTDNTTSGQHRISQLSLSAFITYAMSVYVKANTHNFIQLLLTSGSGTNGWVTAVANLSNGTISQTGVGANGTLTSTNITSVGNGWYRISLIGSVTTAGPAFRIAMVPAATGNSFDVSDGTVSYVGTTTSLYLWGAQLEPVTYQTTPSTYVATTTAAYYGPRLDYDPVTLAVKGMLVEEARTNLLTYSEQFDNGVWGKNQITVSADATLSPAGTLTADKIIPQAIAGAHSTYNTYTYAAAAYTLSVYAKPAGYSWIKLGSMFTGNGVYFDISSGVVGSANSGYTGTITPAANGFYRCQVTWTASAGSDNPGFYVATANNTNTFTGDGTSGVFAWGMQVEAGAFATSYIPTTTTSVARSADVASLTGTNFSSWYNTNAGTFVVQTTSEYNVSASTTARYLFANTNTNFYVLYTNLNDANIRNFDGTNVLSAAVSDFTAANKFASSYAGTTKNLCVNGGSVASGTYNGGWSSTTSTGVGSSTPTGTGYWNGWIKSITYYPRQLSSAQIQALTT